MNCAKVGECGIFLGLFLAIMCVFMSRFCTSPQVFRQQPPNFIVRFTLFIFVYARRKKGGKTAFRTTSYTKNDVLVSSSQVGSSGFLSSVRCHSIAPMFRIHLFKGKYLFNEKSKEMEPMMQTAKRGNIIDLLCFFKTQTSTWLLKKKNQWFDV